MGKLARHIVVIIASALLLVCLVGLPACGGGEGNLASTSVTLISSQNPSTYGDSVTFTATVSDTSGAPAGTVTFKDGATTLGTVTLSAGQASCTTTTLAVGTHSITAVYSGDASFATSTSTALTQTVNPKALTITANNASKTYGETKSFTETEFTTSGLVNADTVTGVTLTSAGAAATAAVGSYTIVPSAAVGTSLTNYVITYVNGTLTLKPAPTTTTVTSSQNPSTYGDSVTFTATVSDTSGTPTGTVQFKIDGTNWGNPVTLYAGSATSNTTSTLSVGNHTITAVYSRDASFAASTSTALTQMVCCDGSGPGELLGWWETQWSDDGTNVNITYMKGNNTLSETDNVTSQYNQYGILVGRYEEITAIGEDIYVREQNLITEIEYTWRGGGVEPDSTVRTGTFVYPAEMKTEQSQYFRSINSTTIFQYDSNGCLTGGSGSENFWGQISSPTDKITYSGNVTAAIPEIEDGQLFFKQLVETTDYYYRDKLYASTERIISGNTQYLGGKWVTVSENHVTKTTYADGSQRSSDITILWQRNQYGTTSGKSGSGVVTGSEIINGNPVNYTGLITIYYSFDSKIGWYKSGYYESKIAESSLPKRLPFEVIFIDDMYF